MVQLALEGHAAAVPRVGRQQALGVCVSRAKLDLAELYINTVMIVDVVELRERGVKLPRERILATAPFRAELSLTTSRPGWYKGQRNPPLLAGLLWAGETQWAREPLDQARVTAIRGGSLVIIGMQQVTGYGHQLAEYPQAWWCRIVSDPSA